MREEDFEFEHVIYSNGHIDYWFVVRGETAKVLDGQYMRKSSQ